LLQSEKNISTRKITVGKFFPTEPPLTCVLITVVFLILKISENSLPAENPSGGNSSYKIPLNIYNDSIWEFKSI